MPIVHAERGWDEHTARPWLPKAPGKTTHIFFYNVTTAKQGLTLRQSAKIVYTATRFLHFDEGWKRTMKQIDAAEGVRGPAARGV